MAGIPAPSRTVCALRDPQLPQFRCGYFRGHAGGCSWECATPLREHKPGAIIAVPDLPQLGPCSDCWFWTKSQGWDVTDGAGKTVHKRGRCTIRSAAPDFPQRWATDGCGEFLQRPTEEIE